MKEFDCLTSEFNKQVLLKDYGDTAKYSVLCISKNDIIIKTDKRIKSKEDFIELYGYGAVYSKEPLNKALIWNN